MTVRVAINGFGRIGRNVVRALYESGRRAEITVVSKNAERYLEELYSGWTAKEYRDYEDKINRMQESIRQMAPQMRTVVEEFFLNEKKCAEISEILNISDNTVRTHIARALKILRKRLSVFFLFTFVYIDCRAYIAHLLDIYSVLEGSCYL